MNRTERGHISTPLGYTYTHTPIFFLELGTLIQSAGTSRDMKMLLHQHQNGGEETHVEYTDIMGRGISFVNFTVTAHKLD